MPLLFCNLYNKVNPLLHSELVGDPVGWFDSVSCCQHAFYGGCMTILVWASGNDDLAFLNARWSKIDSSTRHVLRKKLFHAPCKNSDDGRTLTMVELVFRSNH